MSKTGVRQRRAKQRPAPASRAYYLEQAETCRAAASRSEDQIARLMYEEECKLWLMLAAQREAIEAVLQRYIDPPAGG